MISSSDMAVNNMKSIGYDLRENGKLRSRGQIAEGGLQNAGGILFGLGLGKNYFVLHSKLGLQALAFVSTCHNVSRPLTNTFLKYFNTNIQYFQKKY